MNKLRAWITGAGGLIGHCVTRMASACAPEWQVDALTRAQLDLTDSDAVRVAFRKDRPGLVVHCAALSKTPACQADPFMARKVNVEVTRVLTELSADIHFVFLSSDLVFDGTRGNYTESDAVNPVNVYGETKVEAEQLVLANPGHTVLRTSLNYGQSPTGDRSFNEELCRLWQGGRAAYLFTDEYRCPIPAVVLARAIWELVGQNETGLFHVAGADRLSRWQIGELIAARCPQLNPKLESGSLRDYGGPQRAPDTSLNCSRVQAVLSFPLPKFGEWLKSQAG